MLVAFIRVHLYPEYMCGRVEAARLFLLPCLFTSSRSGKSRTRNFGRRHGLHGLRVVSNCHHRSAQFGPMAKPAKNKIEKFVKLTDHSYACNSLTNFECDAHGTTGKGPFNNYVDKMRGRGSKNVCFCPRSGYKNCPRRGGGQIMEKLCPRSC